MSETLTETQLIKLKDITILQLAQDLEHVLANDLIHENTSVFEYIEKYLDK